MSKMGPFTVERKVSKSHSAGVVVVSCKSKADRDAILSAKKKLKSSRQYSDVFIHPDLTLQQRIESENMRILVSTLKSVNPDIRVRGSRIVMSPTRTEPNHSSNRNFDRRDSRYSKDHRQNSDSSNRRSSPSTSRGSGRDRHNVDRQHRSDNRYNRRR